MSGQNTPSSYIYSAIDDWNALPNNIKGIKSEIKLKESMNKTLLADAKKVNMNQYP